jgi:hypothetical protein
MRRNLTVVAPALAVIGIVAGATLVSASSTKSPISSPQVLHFREKGTGFHVVIDQPPAGPSVGDEVATQSVLLQNGKVSGHLASTIILTSNKISYSDGAVQLAGGQTTFQGRVRLGQTTPGQSFRLAITGGTGIYQNVKGYVLIQVVSQTVSRDTVYLNP